MKIKAKILRHKEIKHLYGRIIHGELFEEEDLPSQLWNRALELRDIEILLNDNNISKLKNYELIKTELDVI